MDIQQILKVLKNERECILSNHDYCYENCNEFCPYYVSGVEKMKVLDFLIKGYELLQNGGAESYTIKCTEPLSKEQIEHFKEEWGNTSFTASFEPMQFPEGLVAVVPDETAKEIFNGICPYTNIKCEKWTCSICEVEKRERRFMEGDND